MKFKKNKEIIIVPPSGQGINVIHIHRGIIFFFVFLIILGFAGYFIPFNNFTIDVIEKNHKHNLDEQNRRLLSEIRPMRKFLENLDNEISRLKIKKEKISGMIGIDIPDENLEAHSYTKASLLPLDELIPLISNDFELFNSVSNLGHSGNMAGKSCFDDIPVIKPVVTNSFIGTRFGKSRDPFVGTVKMHYGIDFFVTSGSPIIATASGVVSKVDYGRM